jgi:hypothetical protein
VLVLYRGRDAATVDWHLRLGLLPVLESMEQKYQLTWKDASSFLPAQGLPASKMQFNPQVDSSATAARSASSSPLHLDLRKLGDLMALVCGYHDVILIRDLFGGHLHNAVAGAFPSHCANSLGMLAMSDDDGSGGESGRLHRTLSKASTVGLRRLASRMDFIMFDSNRTMHQAHEFVSNSQRPRNVGANDVPHRGQHRPRSHTWNWFLGGFAIDKSTHLSHGNNGGIRSRNSDGGTLAAAELTRNPSSSSLTSGTILRRRLEHGIDLALYHPRNTAHVSVLQPRNGSVLTFLNEFFGTTPESEWAGASRPLEVKVALRDFVTPADGLWCVVCSHSPRRLCMGDHQDIITIPVFAAPFQVVAGEGARCGTTSPDIITVVAELWAQFEVMPPPAATLWKHPLGHTDNAGCCYDAHLLDGAVLPGHRGRLISTSDVAMVHVLRSSASGSASEGEIPPANARFEMDVAISRLCATHLAGLLAEKKRNYTCWNQKSGVATLPVRVQAVIKVAGDVSNARGKVVADIYFGPTAQDDALPSKGEVCLHNLLDKTILGDSSSHGIKISVTCLWSVPQPTPVATPQRAALTPAINIKVSRPVTSYMEALHVSYNASSYGVHDSMLATGWDDAARQEIVDKSNAFAAAADTCPLTSKGGVLDTPSRHGGNTHLRIACEIPEVSDGLLSQHGGDLGLEMAILLSVADVRNGSLRQLPVPAAKTPIFTRVQL